MESGFMTELGSRGEGDELQVQRERRLSLIGLGMLIRFAQDWRSESARNRREAARGQLSSIRQTLLSNAHRPRGPEL
jgi:hypothetical protein